MLLVSVATDDGAKRIVFLEGRGHILFCFCVNESCCCISWGARRRQLDKVKRDEDWAGCVSFYADCRYFNGLLMVWRNNRKY